MTIGVRTEKMHYRAGEVMRGKVYLSVRGKSEPALSILLQLRGQEHSVIHYTTSETERDGRREETYTRDHYDQAKNEFFHTEYPLHTFAGQQVRSGQYEYPFSIHLPTTLPSSMRCDKGQSHCCVEYLVAVTLIRPPSGMFSSDPRDKQKLTIEATPALQEFANGSEVQMPPDEVPVHTCCCHNQGTMVLESQFDKTVVQPNDTIGVHFRGENFSKVKVRKVRIQLEEIVEWTAYGGNRETSKRTLYRKYLNAKQFPELDKLRRRRRRQRLQHYQGVSHEEIPFQGRSGEDAIAWKQAAIQIPRDAYDSYDGVNVHIRHVASVQLLTKGCCTTNPDSTTLVKLYRFVPEVTAKPAEASATAAPSAPSSVYDEYPSTKSTASANAEPTAPAANWDDDLLSSTAASVTATSASAPSELYDDVPVATPMAEAQLLPPDWNAQTAELVEIPMAEATVLGTVGADGSPPAASSSGPKF